MLFLILLWSFCVDFKGMEASEVTSTIYSLHIQSDILYRYSTTLVTSRLANPHNATATARFDVTLPQEAFISNFTMEIDGKVYSGEVKEKQKAKKQFETAKKKGQSAGHVSKSTRDTNDFTLEISIAAFGKVTFNLTYQELLKRSRGLYQHKIYINPGQPVDDLRVAVAIQESRALTTLRVPPIRTDILTNDNLQDENSIAVIEQPSPTTAFITYSPSVSQQTVASSDGISGQFVVEYDIERSVDAGDILVVNGYFVHFMSPSVDTRVFRDILFILDTSSSMRGRKIHQLREAMKIVLGELQPGDRFNIMKFNDRLNEYRPNMVEVSEDAISKANRFVERLSAGGYTNLNAAILRGIEILNKDPGQKNRRALILFLTDGQASTGVRSSAAILQNVEGSNEGDIPIYTMAFGDDADWDLMKKIAIQNNAVAKKIYEDSDAQLQISGFYDELSVTLLNNVSVKYIGDNVSSESLTKATFESYFMGSEMVVAGKIGNIDAKTISLEIFSQGAEGDFVLTSDSGFNVIDMSDVKGMTSESDIETITEKLWAYLTIKQLLDEAEGTLDSTAQSNLKEQAKELSVKYSFVTPLTSIVVTKPEETESDYESDADEYSDNEPESSVDKRILYKPSFKKTPSKSPSLQSSSGQGSGGGRRRYSGGGGGGGGGGYSGGGGGDPHYMIRLPDFKYPLCFDVKSTRSEIHTLLQDPSHHINMFARIIQSGQTDVHGDKKTFISQIAIQLQHHVITATTQTIVFDSKRLSWEGEQVHHFGEHFFTFKRRGNLLFIRFSFGSEVIIVRHVRADREPGAVDFLNVFINHEEGFSKFTTGLLGQFVNGHKHLKLKKEFDSEGGNRIAKIQVRQWPHLGQQNQMKSEGTPIKPSSHTLRARLIERTHVTDSDTEFCWMVHKPFEDILLGTKDDYIVSELNHPNGTVFNL